MGSVIHSRCGVVLPVPACLRPHSHASASAAVCHMLLLLLLLLIGAKEVVAWDDLVTRVPQLLQQIQVGQRGLEGACALLVSLRAVLTSAQSVRVLQPDPLTHAAVLCCAVCCAPAHHPLCLTGRHAGRRAGALPGQPRKGDQLGRVHCSPQQQAHGAGALGGRGRGECWGC